MPIKFWSYAFATAVYLINRMPTKILNLDSPYERIFHCKPNYSKLRIFGSLCYPWIRPYTAHKLESRSVPCIFLGYSLTQSAYLCFHILTGKVYVSRHVKFVESVKPFQHNHSKLDDICSSSICEWTPHVLTIPLAENHTPSLVRSSPAVHMTPSLAQASSRDSQPCSSGPLDTNNLSSQRLLPPPPKHSMTTRSKNNIKKTVQKLNLNAQLETRKETEPPTVKQALRDPKWQKAMSEEFNALVCNDTWDLVPATPD